jgi:secreted trypsin-like serine protease
MTSMHPSMRALQKLITSALAVLWMLSGLASAPAAAEDRPLTPLVVGGESTENPGYVAALLIKAEADAGVAQFCGGTLISSTIVLTAAHCVDWTTAADIDVAIGKTLLSSIAPADRIDVDEIAFHSGWVTGGILETDLALLQLSTPVLGAPPIQLEDNTAEPIAPRQLIAVGWGYVDPARTMLLDPMQAATVWAVSGPATSPGDGAALCLLVDPVDDFCVGGLTTGICQGDSGSPILGETFVGSGILEVVGVVSFGPASQCLHPSLYDAAQSIAPYKSWIDSTMADWADLPSAPVTPMATWGNGSVSVSWTAPTSDGGDSNLTYDVTGSPGGTCTTTSSSCVVPGLTNGVEYGFTITATNGGGTGPSAITNSVTPLGPPTAPGIPTVERGDATANLSWSAPTSNGGDPNLSYAVTGTPSGSCTTITLSCEITGLPNGVEHTFSVTATNGAGTGPGSAPSPGAVPVAVLLDCSGAVAHDFIDVGSSFATNDIGCIFALEVTTGTSPTTYAPSAFVTRDQMAAFIARLYRAITGNECGIGPTPFTDIADSFAATDISCIYSLGVTTGTSDTTFSPGDRVTRAQMAAFIARLYRTITGNECGPGPTPFTDISGLFATADIGCIFELGVTTGTSSTTYAPDDHVTREQMAAFLALLYRTITA